MGPGNDESLNVPVEEVYRQQYAHFGRMNNLLYQFPLSFSTIIGALWYFAFSFKEDDSFVAALVLVFSFAVAFAGILIIHRFRLAFNGYIGNLNKMDGRFSVSLKGSKVPSAIGLIQGLLALSALISLFGLLYVIDIQPIIREWVCG